MVTGLKELQKTLEDASKALNAIGGQIGTISFEPTDPESIEHAISQMEAMIDEKVGKYSNNKIVAPLIIASKEKFRQGILDKAASARLGGSNDDQ